MASVSDGLAPFTGKAGDVRVGHLIQGSKGTKSDVWEVLEMKNPQQIAYGHGMWWRVVNIASGLEAFIPPKALTSKITFMVPEAELAECERSGRPPWEAVEFPADADEVALLVEKLGATLIAQRDNATGEIHCPDYASGHRHTEEWSPGILGRDQLEHLKICHGVDISALELESPAKRAISVIDLHGKLHMPHQTISGGFPHRHVPEDLSKF